MSPVKAITDHQHLLLVQKNGPVGQFDLYKAAVALANVGALHAEEAQR